MIKLLPKWVLTDRQPAFYDSESDTCLEQVARLHGKMEELIKDYNKFIDEVNSAIISFQESTTNDMECFKSCITHLIEKYITSIDLKISNQDLKIDEAVSYMQTNIIATAESIINEAIENGIIQVGLSASYNAETEELGITVIDNGGA